MYSVPIVRPHAAAAIVIALSSLAAGPARAQAPVATPTLQLVPPSPPILTPPAPVPRVYPKLTLDQSHRLIAMLDNSGSHGLWGSAAGREAAAADPSDTQLIDEALAYARAVHSGQLADGNYPNAWGLRPAAYDPWPDFAAAIARGKLASWIAALPPPYAGYDGLRKGLARYRAIAANGGWAPLATGPDLTIGASGARVAALRQRLAVEDADVAATGDRFDQDLLDAVRRAQRRYGLNPSGIVSTQTIAALNVPAAERVHQITANMERWRWLPRDLAQNRVQVNIAAAVLTVFDGDAPVTSMKAVTGRPGDETPMLQSQIHSIVLNPPWNVPTTIAGRELWPKERAHPGYLKSHGFKVIATPDGGKRLMQSAGSHSALGHFKFDFDNPYAVYLHDTPTQSTFSSFDRLASHGCVRLEKPEELAALLLKPDPAWPDDRIQAAVAKGDTVRVRLQSPIAVYLFYWTAFASANGQINFRADPYGWDAMLTTRIAAQTQGRPTPAPAAAPVDTEVEG